MLTSLIRVMKVGTFSMPFVPTVISSAPVYYYYEYYHCGAAQTASSVILYQISNNTTVPKLNIDVQTSQEVRLRNVELNWSTQILRIKPASFEMWPLHPKGSTLGSPLWVKLGLLRHFWGVTNVTNVGQPWGFNLGLCTSFPSLGCDPCTICISNGGQIWGVKLSLMNMDPIWPFRVDPKWVQELKMSTMT